jgi:phosphoglycolate phosphatase-like HAD superfamily hydrolase
MKTILWDFDGVILNSNKVRDWGFEQIFSDFDTDLVNRLLVFHKKNGGLSRYVKIRYFFEKLLNESVTEKKIQEYANKFSVLMRTELINPDNLISETVSFIQANSMKYNFHIVSGSDQNELRFLCEELKIKHHFLSIHGSPTPKIELVKILMEKHNYEVKETCLIGDSVNDYDAANENNIQFYGYNNEALKDISSSYISSFTNFKIN